MRVIHAELKRVVEIVDSERKSSSSFIRLCKELRSNDPHFRGGDQSAVLLSLDHTYGSSFHFELLLLTPIHEKSKDNRSNFFAGKGSLTA